MTAGAPFRHDSALAHATGAARFADDLAEPPGLLHGALVLSPVAHGVLDALDKFVPPSCDKAALRILGLSMAGWNAVASLILAAVAFRGALSRG